MSDVPGDEATFERLYATHHRAILSYCARRTSMADAMDAAAETFLTAWRRIDALPDPAEELPWLIGVAFRVLANQRRSTRRRAALVRKVGAASVDLMPAVDEPMIRGDQELFDALAGLSPQDREILQLTIWEEMTPSEISDILGISRDAIDHRYSRAKKRLARHLESTRSQLDASGLSSQWRGPA